MRALKIIVLILIIIIIPFIFLISTATITDYKPDEVELISQVENTPLISDSIFSVLIWNIGYAGLSSEMDFFYDGGKKVRPDDETVKKNIQEISVFLKEQKEADFILLQEVDKKSKRSYSHDEVNVIESLLPNYYSDFAYNYKVAFVPLPPTNPMGKVSSGLLSLSKEQPAKVERFSFPGNYSWPKNLFMLDRCFLVARYKLKNQKELVIINTHNSAYDDGSLRDEQMNYLKSFILAEYQKGNYIVVGGDWNQSPPNFSSGFNGYLFDNENFKEIPEDFLPEDWKWCYTNTIPTNRRVKTPFEKEKTLTTVIDFFLLSPNIETLEVRTIDLNFSNSDHNPVLLSFKL